MKQKFANALSLALIMSMLFTSIGLADQFTPDNDVFTPGNQNSVNLSAAPGATVTTSAQLFVEYQGSRHLVPSTTVNFSVNTSQTNLPSGYTVSSLSSTVPGNWNDNSDQFVAGTSNISFTAPSAGSYTYTVKWNDTDSCSSGDCLTQTGAFTINLMVTAPLNTEPSLGLPSNIVTEATSAAGAMVTYSATATDAQDDPDPTPSCAPASGSTFPLGTTTVNCSVTDSGGMSASGSFTVTVEDTTAPALNLPSTITAEATGPSGAAVSYTASAIDLVDGSVTINCSPASGATFPLGNNTVNCSASDSRGNSASGSFSVVVADTTGPDLSLPANITEEASGASGNAITYSASATDAVDGNVSVTCTPPSGSTFPIAATTVNCSATDAAGNTANGSFSVTIADTTAPVIAAHGDETAEATGPAGAIVNYTSPATSDVVDGAGVASCSPASGSTFPLGETLVTCNASDAAGNAATPTTFKVNVVDTTDPTITFDSRTPANAAGWNNGDVTVNWTCADAVGVLAASVSQTVTTEGEAQSAMGTCTDTSGNTASDTQIGINIDKTKPTISAAATTPANGNGWYNGDVTVHFTCEDALSGIPAGTCPDDQLLNSEGAAVASTAQTVIDAAGNTSDPSNIVTVSIDKTPPTANATASPAANANGWNNSAVTVSFSGSDALSGIDFCGEDAILSSEGAGQVASDTCTDNAGNVSTTASATVNIDLTAPSVALVGGPANGGTYYFGFVPDEPTCNASDALSGLDGACSVSGYSAAVGGHTVSASATDKAGNAGSASASYTVSAWTIRGFYQPVDMNGVVNTVKGGSTVPLKFEVFAGSTELTNTAIVSTLVKQVTCNATTEDTVEVLATGGTSLRYDSTSGQFIFNWQTPKLPGKCYSVTLTTQEGSAITALFKLK